MPLPTNLIPGSLGHIADSNKAYKKLNGFGFDVQADYGAAGDGVADDTAEIQAAIDAAGTGGGGTVFLPPGTYKTTASLNINKRGVRLVGAGGFVKFISGQSWWLRGGQQGVGGTVINLTTASTDAIVIQNTDGSGLPLNDVGIEELAIAFGASVSGAPTAAGIATGHGINVKPPTSGSVIRNSAVRCHLRNVIVYGHDGDHYGWRLEGINESSFGALTTYGGGGLLVKAPDINSTFYGAIMVYWQNPGAAHGVHLDGVTAVGGSAINFTSFNYIQSNADFGAGSSAAYCFKANNLYRANAIAMLNAEIFSGTPAGAFSTDGTGLVAMASSHTGLWNQSGSQRDAIFQYQGSNPNTTDSAFGVRTGNFPNSSNVWEVDYAGKQTIGGDVNLYRSAANVLKTDDQLIATDGVQTKYISGAGKTTVVDGDFTATPPNGTLAVHYDTTGAKAYLSVRANGVWKVMAGPI